MAFKRKRAAIRRPRKKSRVYKSRVARPVSMAMRPVSIARTVNLSYWQPSTATTNDFWRFWSFNLENIPSYLEFTALFDQYRINRIKCVFRPRFDSFAGNDTTDTTAPGITNTAGTNLHIVVDPRSTVSPAGTYTRANMNTFMENGKVRTYNGNKAVSVYFKPATYQQVAGSNSLFIYSPWLQTGGSNIPHYGFHSFAQDINMSGTFGQSWDVFVTFYMQFKGLK